MKDKTLIYSLVDIDKAVSFLKQVLISSRVLAIAGSLGAGKTTLAGHLLKALGVQGPITSPTFSYVNTYKTIDGKKVHHFDLYRIGSVEEFVSSGFDEYLHDPEAIVLIEWPEIITDQLPKNTARIELDYDSIDRRKIRLRN